MPGQILKISVNLLKTGYGAYRYLLSPGVKKTRKSLRKINYLIGSGSRIIEGIKDKNGKTLMESIAAKERVFIESQGVELNPKGELIFKTLTFLEDLKSSNGPEFNEAVDKTIKTIESLAEFTPYEIRKLYKTFKKYLDQDTLDFPITKINKNARGELIIMLEDLKKQINDLATFGEKEKITLKIDKLRKELAAAKISPAKGKVDYLSKLESSFTLWGIAHEAGHPIFRKKDVEWPSFTPLTFRSINKDREEDFCENFALYINGYLFFWLLAKISKEWKEKYLIINKLVKPKSYLPNPVVLGDLIQYVIIRANRDFSLNNFLKKLEEKLKSIIFTDEYERHFNAFRKNFKEASKLMDMNSHRRIIANLFKEGLLGQGESSTIRYQGKSLEEHGLSPEIIAIIELLREIPEPVKKCLDANEGGLVSILFGFAKIVIVTPYGIDKKETETTDFSNIHPQLKSTVEYPDLSSIPISDREIRASLEASKLESKEYYRTFEEKFNLKLEDSPHRAFSKDQIDFLIKIFEKIPPPLLKHLKKVKRITSQEHYILTIETGTISIDDELMSFINDEKPFLYNFSLIISYHICTYLLKTKNRHFRDFIDSGGWKIQKNFLRKSIALMKNIPLEIALCKTDYPNDNFLGNNKTSVTADFGMHLYFSIALPGILNEIINKNPKIKERFGLFQKVIESL